MIDDKVIQMAKSLWDYNHMNHQLEKSDCILALGSHDLRVADRAADVFLEGWAPLLIFSGGLGNYTQGRWTTPEADLFAEIAIKKGVPENVIIIENRSTNTGENIKFTKALLEERKIDPESFIVVQKPYMERRSYATFKQHWPDKKVLITSPQLSLEQYAGNEEELELEINIMVGDIQRIKEYPSKGFQIYQEIPDDVWSNYEKLIALGFTRHLMK